ncbi:MAG TPA: ATP-binding protein, partial [Thermoanaerobaculia bacterium]|nr:ATP-binding protein [Thermoanaerobaculia bacterium]
KGIEVLDPHALSGLEAQFARQEPAWPGSYLCVIDDQGILRLHTADRSKVGQSVGDRKFVGHDERGPNPSTLSDLLAKLKDANLLDPSGQAKDSWIGRYESLEGETQMAAFVYVPRLVALVAIHVPWSDVERQIQWTTLPWALGLGLIVLLAIPLSLWGLSKAYTDTERDARRAHEAERRAAEKIRILRDIDRAILAGGSVEEIVRAALAGMEPLIRYHRASVALFLEKGRVARVLAVQSAGGTGLGAGAEVPIDDLAFLGLEELRSGRASIIPDLDACVDLPAFMKRLRGEGVRSMAKLPLACRGELLGTLNLSFDHVGEPSDEDLELAREVADVLALAVLQGQLREKLELQAAELEQRVVERTQQLSEVNAELEGYVRSVSHDLRAPLRAVHGFGNLLLEEAGGKLAKTEREYLERMVSASGRMNALVRDLLTYSRLAREDVEVRPLDLQNVVEEARDLLQVELDERGAAIEIVQPLLSVVGHHTSLVQAMANLISNAAKFVAPGVHPRIRVHSEGSGDRVRLWVEDNGIGIPQADQEKMFRMFERLNGSENYPGTGIGLAIVRRAVERMGGIVGVESRSGEGSRFWIELPGAEVRG